MTREEIDHDMTEQVVCPYCGHKHGDSHEFFPRAATSRVEITCDHCGKTFDAWQEVEVTYTTIKRDGAR